MKRLNTYLTLILLLLGLGAMGQTLDELFSLSKQAENSGDYQKKLEVDKQILDSAIAHFGKHDTIYASVLSMVANDYTYIGNYQKSKELNEQCLKIYETLYGKNHPDYAVSLNNLATNYSDLGNYEKSKELNEQCLKICEILYGKNHPDYASSLTNLAYNYSDLGNYAKSKELNEQALFTRETLYGVNHPSYALSLNNLAGDYSDLGNYIKSNELYEKCLKTYKTLFGKKHPSYALSLNNLACNYIRLKDYLAADSLSLQSYQLEEEQYFSNSTGLSETEKEKYINGLFMYLYPFTSYTLERHKKTPSLLAHISSAWLNVKGSLLSSNQRIKEEVFASGDTTLVSLYESWQIGRMQLGKYYEKTLQELEKNGVDIKAEEERVNGLEQELSRRSLSFAEAQKRYTWQDVQNKLGADEVYIELIRAPYYDFKKRRRTDTVRYAALVIDKTTKDHPQLVLFKNGNELEGTHYQQYRSHITNPSLRKDTTKLLSAYNNYWAPIDSVIKDKKTVYLSLDGVYNKLNLNTLITPEGQYLGNTKDIRLVSSGRELMQKAKSKPNTIKNAVLVGNPKFDLDMDTQKGLVGALALSTNSVDDQDRYRSLDRWGESNSTSELPGTREEVNTISQLLSGHGYTTTTLLQEHALEEAVKAVSSPTVLHIATHGFFSEDVELEKDRSFTMGMERTKAVENPLLRSGLLLAGADRAKSDTYVPQGNMDNGILTAYEVQNIRLSNTELVVLSACETGLGEVKNGEGVYGLQRAFRAAGAQTLIMSLWKVGDTATQLLMSSFYESWLGGMSKRDAFKAAQESLRKNPQYRHPYYWGGFVMIGK